MSVEHAVAMERPRRCPGTTIVELDDNVALYDEVGQLLILLNVSAAAVWGLCDGATTLEEMTRTLAEQHPDQASLIAVDVRATVLKLLELGLVTDDGHGQDPVEGAGTS